MTTQHSPDPNQTLRVGLVSVSDRASQGVYQDQGIPALNDWLARALTTPFEAVTRLIQDDAAAISGALIELVDVERCPLVLTTGGTGPARRDVTPEATAPLLDKRADSLCELMRLRGLGSTEFAHLSRGIAGVCQGALVVNLPGSPKAVFQGVRAIAMLLKPILQNLHGEGCSAHE